MEQDFPLDLSTKGNRRREIEEGGASAMDENEPLDLTTKSSASKKRPAERGEDENNAVWWKKKKGGKTEYESGQPNNKPYKILLDPRTKVWKTGIEEMQFKVKFEEEKAGEKLVDIRSELVSMFDDVIHKAAKDYGKGDKARLTINHSHLENEVFIHLQNLENLNGDVVMNRFERVLNSHKDMTVDNSFDISVGLMRMTKGGGKNRVNAISLLPHLHQTKWNSIARKNSIVEIVCSEGEHICAAKALAALHARDTMKRKDYKNFIQKDRQCTNGSRGMRRCALTLLSSAGLPSDRPLTVAELWRLEDIVQAKILVVTFKEDEITPAVIQCSNKKFNKEYFLYLASEHFHAVVNPNALFHDRIICRQCYDIYVLSDKRTHGCNRKWSCFACERPVCEWEANLFCQNCNLTFRNETCYKSHCEKSKKSGKSLCDVRKKCLECGKIVMTDRDHSLVNHVCGTYKCRLCKEWVTCGHLCFLRRKQMTVTSGKFIFFDFESVFDEVFECEDGYKPLKPVGCGQIDKDFGLCKAGNLCSSCRKCLNCKKSHCGRKEHQPNMVVAESCCDKCSQETLTSTSVCKVCGDTCDECHAGNKKGKECLAPSTCGRRRVVFKGLMTVFDFCSWVFTPKHKGFTAIAHNGKAYDFCFVLNWLVTEARITPACIYSGSKLMSLHVKHGLDIRFVDSLNFLMMALKKLPKAFGLKEEMLGIGEGGGELAKGDFPYKFNTRKNWEYVGEYPPLEMYGVDGMGHEERERVTRWHAQRAGKTFNLQEQLETYCTLDTSILRLACMTFRELLINITRREQEDGTITYVDCFRHLTLASCVMQIYRLNHIQEFFDVTLSDGRMGRAVTRGGGEWEMMASGEQFSQNDIIEKLFVSSNLSQIPAQGYVRTSNHSTKSIQWLEWMSKNTGKEIQHARNRGEKQIRCGSHVYKVDGFDEASGTIYEFYGCRYHGHNCMGDGKTIRDPRNNFSMKDLQERTLRREQHLKASGFKLVTIYECKFDKMVKENEQLREFLTAFDVPKRLVLREAFFGGRTSAFKLHYKCDPSKKEEIHYLDVVSLYPFILKSKRMPMGHPEIVCRDFDMSMDSYFGVAHAKLLPPRHEYVGVLPFRARGKLHFPLCRTCCETGQTETCMHSEEQRALRGVWCTPEIKEAMKSGYKLLELYEVYHYKDSSQYDPDTRKGGMFAQQVDLFLKIKAQASGYPEWVQSDSDKDQFIQSFEDKCGVKLEKDKIEINPALRSISKLCLNSFWGKLGEKNNKTKTKFVTKLVELTEMMVDQTIVVTNFHIVNENVLVLEYVKTETFEEDSNITNELIAAFTTCFARLELLKHIRSVGRDIVYCDTDSIIFVTRKNEEGCYPNYPETGQSLGELDSELPQNVHIVEFVCSGPKSYSYKTNEGKETCKFKGVCLNPKNSQRVNFEAVKELVFGSKDCLRLEPQIQFNRSKFDGIVTNAPLVKKLVHTFDKRIIKPDMDTVPYGYVCASE